MTDSHAPAVCVQGTIANGKRMGQNGLGASEGACYTLDTVDAHAVCYAQNQRYEVRRSGDGTTCGAIPASQSGKQFDFVCVASTQANAERSEDCSPCLTSHLAKDTSVVCMADDNAHAAVDADVCGTLKVGGGAPCVAFHRTGRASSGRSAPGTPRESGASSPERGR